MKTYLTLAYYIFTPIENPEEEVRRHKEFFESKEVTGRIYISHEGINGQMSGAKEDALSYIEWFRQDPRFSQVTFKIDEIEENIFPRMTVKTRKELVAIGEKVDLSKTGKKISPDTWQQMLENEEDIFLLDVRNDYEWKIGHFEKAHLPALEYFRDFPKYAEKLKTKLCLKTKVMMYCTGGIRCEVYSALLKEKGFENVYQLDGGVINYGHEKGGKHWKGKLFVFDDRLAVSIDQEEKEPISHCVFCSNASDTYYNCANMDCNALFLACVNCIKAHRGACCSACEVSSPRLRPYDTRMGNKPFRKAHLLTTRQDQEDAAAFQK